MDHPLDLHRHGTESRRLRGGMPLPPNGVAVIEKKALHDRREKCRKAAAPFEFADDRVIILDELQLHDRREVFRLLRADVVAFANERDDAVDEVDVLDEKRLGIDRQSIVLSDWNCGCG